jgi:hypothetical protein
MNSQERAELLAAIAELSRRYPDWRLGQLIAHVAGWADQRRFGRVGSEPQLGARQSLWSSRSRMILSPSVYFQSTTS